MCGLGRSLESDSVMTCGADADEGRDFRGGRGEFEEQDRGGAAQGEHDDQGESAFRCEHACMHMSVFCECVFSSMHIHYPHDTHSHTGSVCVCARARVCVCVCVCVRARACLRSYVSSTMHTCAHSQVKAAGVAGLVSYALWEFVFWTVSVPLSIYTYHATTGEWPSFDNPESTAKVSNNPICWLD